MKIKFIIIGTIILLCLLAGRKNALSQDSLELIILSSKVGEVIDLTEKKRYRLFPYYSSNDFESAQLYRLPDNSMILKAKMKDGTLKEKRISDKEYKMFRVMVGEAIHGGVSYADLKGKEQVVASQAEPQKEWADRSEVDKTRSQFKRPPPRTNTERKRITRSKMPGKKHATAGALLILGAPLVVFAGLAISLGNGSYNVQGAGDVLAWVGLLSIPVGIVLVIDGGVKNHRYRKQQRLKKKQTD